MRFNRPDLIFHLRHTSFFFARNYFPNPASRPTLFSESHRPAEFIFPNPAGQFFFPNPADRNMSVRKFLSERCPFENFGSIDSIIHSIRSILVELTSGDRPGNRSFRSARAAHIELGRTGFQAGIHKAQRQVWPRIA